MLNRLRRWLCPDLAIDLGTANTLIAVQGSGIVLDEPSVVALQKGTRKVLGQGTAVGKLARQMLGRTPDSINCIRPLQDGVINDFEMCEAMLRYFIRKALHRGHGLRPRVVIAVPGGITPVERRAVFNSAERAGAGQVYLISESKAAGIGAGLPISEPIASMVCDIGGGTTDVAIFSLGDVVAGRSIRIAGDEMDEAIVQYLQQNFSLKIGIPTAEQVKIDIGSAYPLDQELTAEVRGRDTVSGVPRKSVVTSEEIREALREPIGSILNCIKSCIQQCDPELVADLVDNGLVLTGGGALLANMDTVLRQATGLPVSVAEDPLLCVALGTGHAVENIGRLRGVLSSMY